MSFVFYEDIIKRRISFNPICYKSRYDNCSNKLREIAIASIKQQVFDYIAVNAAKEMFSAKIGKYQCASIPGRGCFYGLKVIEKWIRTNPNKARYAFKCDISKYYPSIDKEKLKKLLERDIKNKDVLYVIVSLIDTYKQGLSIGSYLSQYLANYYLSYAYHYIDNNIFKIRKKRNGERIRTRLIHHHLFYMDDIILIGSSMSNVKKAANMLEKYLNDFLRLSLKEDKILFPIDKRVIDMMGFKIYRDHTEIRKRIFIRIRKLLIKYKTVDSRKNMTLKDARSLVSYWGWVRHTDSKYFNKKYKVDIITNCARGVIKNESRIY